MIVQRPDPPAPPDTMRFALWGFRRGDYAYEVMPAHRAYIEGLTVIAVPDWSRDYVTVACSG